MPENNDDELLRILIEAENRGSLIDQHPAILARKRSPDSHKNHKHIARAGGTYTEAPSHDWSTHGGDVSSDEFNARWHGANALIKKGGV
jgi:hypothetical protein